MSSKYIVKSAKASVVFHRLFFSFRKKRSISIRKIKTVFSFRVRVCVYVSGRMLRRCVVFDGGVLCANVGFVVMYFQMKSTLNAHSDSVVFLALFSSVYVMVSRRRRAHFNVGRSGFLFTLILIFFPSVSVYVCVNLYFSNTWYFEA